MKSTQFRIIFVRTTAAERFPSIPECVLVITHRSVVKSTHRN